MKACIFYNLQEFGENQCKDILALKLVQNENWILKMCKNDIYNEYKIYNKEYRHIMCQNFIILHL